jgi:hypothetical protein
MRTFFLLVSAIAIQSYAQMDSGFIPTPRDVLPEGKYPCEESSRAFLEMSNALESIMGKFVQTSEYLHDHPGYKPKYRLHIKKFMKSAFKLKKDFIKMAKDCGRRFRKMSSQDKENEQPVNPPTQKVNNYRIINEQDKENEQPVNPSSPRVILMRPRTVFNNGRIPMARRRIPESFWEGKEDTSFKR